MPAPPLRLFGDVPVDDLNGLRSTYGFLAPFTLALGPEVNPDDINRTILWPDCPCCLGGSGSSASASSGSEVASSSASEASSGSESPSASSASEASSGSEAPSESASSGSAGSIALGGIAACCQARGNLPFTLFITFSGATGDCACLNGVTVPVSWTGTVWTGTFTACGGDSTITFTQSCTIGMGGHCLTNPATSGITPTVCSSTGFAGTATLTMAGSCCTGTIFVTITEA